MMKGIIWRVSVNLIDSILILSHIDMIFADDAILLSFFSRYEGEDEQDLKDAIIKYCKGGIMD